MYDYEKEKIEKAELLLREAFDVLKDVKFDEFAEEYGDKWKENTLTLFKMIMEF